MKSLNVSPTNFEAVVDTSETLILRFVLSEAEVSQDQILTSLIPSAVLAHCNVKQDPALAQTFGLEDESALLIFRQRIILYVEKGFHDTEKVSYLMQQISLLDMDKIRQNIEQEKAAEALHMRRACPISRGKMI
jgi:hypothetical protein